MSYGMVQSTGSAQNEVLMDFYHLNPLYFVCISESVSSASCLCQASPKSAWTDEAEALLPGAGEAGEAGEAGAAGRPDSEPWMEALSEVLDGMQVSRDGSFQAWKGLLFLCFGFRSQRV